MFLVPSRSALHYPFLLPSLIADAIEIGKLISILKKIKLAFVAQPFGHAVLALHAGTAGFCFSHPHRLRLIFLAGSKKKKKNPSRIADSEVP